MCVMLCSSLSNPSLICVLKLCYAKTQFFEFGFNFDNNRHKHWIRVGKLGNIGRTTNWIFYWMVEISKGFFSRKISFTMKFWNIFNNVVLQRMGEMKITDMLVTPKSITSIINIWMSDQLTALCRSDKISWLK